MFLKVICCLLLCMYLIVAALYTYFFAIDPTTTNLLHLILSWIGSVAVFGIIMAFCTEDNEE